MTVGADLDTPAGCPPGSDEGTGYGVGKGKPSKLQEQAAWSSNDFKVISCPAEAAVLTGGGPGHAAIGAVQSEGSGLNDGAPTASPIRPFRPLERHIRSARVDQRRDAVHARRRRELSASEDSAGGLDASWIDGRGVMLAHSSDGGASWRPPSITGIEGGDIVVVGTSPGLASIAYTANPGGGVTQEYLAPSL